MLENSAREILSTFENSESFLILTHKKPDGDALGSSLALMRALRARGLSIQHGLLTRLRILWEHADEARHPTPKVIV